MVSTTAQYVHPIPIIITKLFKILGKVSVGSLYRWRRTLGCKNDWTALVGQYKYSTRKEYNTTLYSERGIMEICRWSRQPKANIFMDWVWDIIEKYRHNELQPNLQPLIDSLSILTQTITTMQQDINTLKESQSAKKLPEKKYSRWKTNTFNKLNTLLSYVNTHSEETLKLSEIIHLVIQETEDTYNIEINDYVEAYKSEFNLETNPYAIDVVNHYKDIKDMFTLALDSIMDKLNLSENTKSVSKNIFDVLAEEINNTTTDKAS